MWFVLLATMGCAGDDPCRRCESPELCVEHRLADESISHGSCVDVPPACPEGLDCADTLCVLELHDRCDAGFEFALCDDAADEGLAALICYEE